MPIPEPDASPTAAPCYPKPPKYPDLGGIFSSLAGGFGTVTNSIGGLASTLGNVANQFNRPQAGTVAPLQATPLQAPQQNGGFIVGPGGQLIPLPIRATGLQPIQGPIQFPPGTTLTPIGQAAIVPITQGLAQGTQGIVGIIPARLGQRMFTMFGLDAAAGFGF